MMEKWQTSYGEITIAPNPRSEGWTVKNDGVVMFRASKKHRALDYAVAVYGVELCPVLKQTGKYFRQLK